MKKLIAMLLLISILLTACQQPANPSVSDQSGSSSDSNVSSSIPSSSGSLSSNSSSSLSNPSGSSSLSSSIATSATPEQQKIADQYYETYVKPLEDLISSTFEKPEDLSPVTYYIFFRNYINDTYTYEERLKRYLNNQDGWLYPAEELETYVQTYFDVSVEHLRSNPFLYHEEGHYYQILVGGPILKPLPMTYEDIFIHPENPNLITFSLAVIPLDDEMPRLLTIELTNDGFRYISNIDPNKKTT